MVVKPLVPVALPVKIVSDRVTLRRVVPSFAPAIFTAVDSSRTHLKRFLPWVDLMRSVEDEIKFTKICLKGWKKRESFHYAIFLNDTKEIIGTIGPHRVLWKNQLVELGYWVARRHQGCGYVSEALGVLEKAIFAAGFHRIEIRCSVVNKRSSAIPQRAGYVLEGILRDDAVENGKFRTTMVFSKLGKSSKM